MKTWLKAVVAITLLVALTACGHSPVVVTPPPPINRDFSITLTWNYDFTNMIQCSGTVTKGCISGFTVGYLVGSTMVTLPGNPVPLSACTGSTQPVTCRYTGNSQLPLGSVTWFATVNGTDTTGAAETGTTNSGTPTVIAIVSPTNVTGSAQ